MGVGLARQNLRRSAKLLRGERRFWKPMRMWWDTRQSRITFVIKCIRERGHLGMAKEGQETDKAGKIQIRIVLVVKDEN